MTYAVTGIPSNYRAPLTAFQLIFGLGASSAAAGPRSALYVGKKTSAGTATINTRYAVTSEDRAIDLFGAGSDLHIIARTHIAKNPTGKVYMACHLASSGGSPVAATADIVITGTATGTGSFIVEGCGESFEVGYVSGDTPTVMGETLEGLINARTHLPLTSVNTTGTNAVTAKAVGASQNGVYMLRVVKQGDSGTGVSVSVSAEYLAGGVDGSTTEASLFSACLTAVAASSDYYHGIPQTVAAFSTALKTHITNRSLPLAGKRSRGFFPAVGALGATTTITTGLNYERLECVWQRGASQTPQQLVAWYVASKQLEEQVQSRFNFDNYSANGFIKPAPDVSDWPTHESDLGDAVNAGISPIVSTDTGAYLAMGVTTRCRDATGALEDFRASEPHRVSVLDELAATVSLNHQLTYANFAQQDDPRLPDGSVDVASLSNITGRKTTPFLFKSWFLQQLQPFFDERLQDQGAWEAGTNCRIDPENNGRIQVTSTGRTIDLHHQATFRISETTAN
ncbi:MAG TPA: hypothetical protein VGK73_08660 [Polyangiaceae bacterium]